MGLADGLCKVRRHRWRIPGVVGTSSRAHHVTMNEFADQGRVLPARPVGQPPRPADTPVWVHVVCVWDAGIPPPVARELRQAERDLFRALASPDPGAWKVRDFTLSAGDGFVLDSPARSQIAVRKTEDEVYALLGREPQWADKTPPLIRLDPPGPTRQYGCASSGTLGSRPRSPGSCGRPNEICFARWLARIPAPAGCRTCSPWTSGSPQGMDSWLITRSYPRSPSARPRMGSTCCWSRIAPTPSPFVPTTRSSR